MENPDIPFSKRKPGEWEFFVFRLREYPYKNVAVIADGAAFGAEMPNIVGLQRMNPNKISCFSTGII